jgi:putative membrane protein
MPLHAHAAHGIWQVPFFSLFLFCAAWLYLHGWIRFRRMPGGVIPIWKAAAFLLGVFLIWVASESPIAAYDHRLLTFHMVKHLLLMTFAPPLVLLGEPAKVFRNELPRVAAAAVRRVSRQPVVCGLIRTLTRPVTCYIVSTVTLLLWHLPPVFALAVRSEIWHTTEQSMFLVAGLMFWWPVVEPGAGGSATARWSILLYLFLATLPCDILSGFLVFSDRIVYPEYASAARMFGLSAVGDQQCAGALMWTCVTLVYLVPAVILSARLLSPLSFDRGDLVQSDLRDRTASQGDSQRLEAI